MKHGRIAVTQRWSLAAHLKGRWPDIAHFLHQGIVIAVVGKAFDQDGMFDVLDLGFFHDHRLRRAKGLLPDADRLTREVERDGLADDLVRCLVGQDADREKGLGDIEGIDRDGAQAFGKVSGRMSGIGGRLSIGTKRPLAGLSRMPAITSST